MKIVLKSGRLLTLKDEDYFRLPLIGKRVKILSSPGFQSSSAHQWCRVIDETKYTLVVLCEDNKTRRVFKKNTWFMFEFYGKFIKIYGDILIGRPEERIKKRLPKPHRVLW
ncbi:MAG: ribonuclease P protein subunit [Candidatus Nanohaloarchaeota archaeon]|nr:ribonuclease P protein subunit [Candidatus Nanohaloarchaeota archaeon]